MYKMVQNVLKVKQTYMKKEIEKMCYDDINQCHDCKIILFKQKQMTSRIEQGIKIKK